MTEKPHGAQVQDGRPARRPDLLDHRRGRLQRRHRVGAVDGGVGEAGSRRQRRLHPARRARDRDAPAVVLADDQQGQRQPGVHRVARGVEGAHSRGVVDRGVPQAGHDDGVLRPRSRDSESLGAVQRESQTDRSRQVGGDRRGLGDHVQRRVAEHLVATAGDGLVPRGGEPQQHVAHRIHARHLCRASAVEPARAVVQERGVGRAQCHGDGRVALVPRRADRVEALAGCEQPPGLEVEVPAQRLGLEELEQLVVARLGQARSGQPGGHGRPEVLVGAGRHGPHDAVTCRLLAG